MTSSKVTNVPLNVFVSYARADSELKDRFKANFAAMERDGLVKVWTDVEIPPGSAWSQEIEDNMKASQIILFMVSTNFLASEFIRQMEIPLALQLENEGSAVIVPIILTHTPGLKSQPWMPKIQAVPSTSYPVDDAAHWGSLKSGIDQVDEQLRAMIPKVNERLRKKREGAKLKGPIADELSDLEITSVSESLAQPRSDKAAIATSERGHGSPNGSWLAWLGMPAVIALILGSLFYFVRSSTPLKETPQVQAETEVSPELKAWLNAPQIDHSVLVVWAAKGNGMFQNGLRQLTLGGPPVVARRLHEYLWEDPKGKVVEGYNGTIWEIVLKDPTGNPITKEVKVTVFFDAVKAARSANEINAIQVDPSDTFGYELYTGDCPPGLPYASHVTGVPLALWKPEDVCLSPVFYTGNKGHIPEGKHRVALEAKIEGKPVYRCLFDISVPPLIESMPQKDWVKSIPESGVEVSVVDKSVCWPSEQEISWKVQIRADPAQLKPPLGIVRYFQASDHKNVASSVWTADPYKDNRINTSIEIEGFNRWEHSWGAGWDGMPTFKNDVAIQPITVHCGPRGKFQGGKHPVAIEISSRGDPVWRGILSLEVPAKTWSFSDNQNLLDITTEDDKDIRNTIIPAVRAGPHKEKGLSNGLSFGPWKFKNKG